MAGDAPRSEEVLSKVLAGLKTLFDQELESVVLYGSATGSDFQPGVSDLNLLVVVSAQGLGHLDRLVFPASQWAKNRVTPPLVMTSQELERSSDVFPLEILNMQLSRRVLHGPDPLASIKIEPGNLRLQCERELRGKLIVLREAFLSSRGREDELLRTALASIKALVAICRGVLHLLGENPSRLNSAEVLDRTATKLGLAHGKVLIEVWRLRGAARPVRGKMPELFQRYLTAVAEAAESVDRLGGQKEAQ